MHGLAVAEIGGLVAIGTAVVPGAGGISAKSAITARSVFPKSVLAISVAVPVVAVVAVIPVAITSAPAIAVPRTRAGAGAGTGTGTVPASLSVGSVLVFVSSVRLVGCFVFVVVRAGRRRWNLRGGGDEGVVIPAAAVVGGGHGARA